MTKRNIEVKTEDGKVVKIYITKPPSEVVGKADMYRAKVWTECIDQGIKTKEQLAKFMVEKGVWTIESVERETDIIEELGILEKRLYIGDSKREKKKFLIEEGKNIAIKMRVLRNELRQIYLERSSIEQNTAEALADNARFDYLVASCTFYENGQKVYNTIEEYNQKAADEIAYSAASELANIMYGYDPKSQESLPENRWLKKFNLVNDKGSLVNKDDKLVDLEGRLINEKGHYIDEQGNRIDIDGNPLDEDGNYKLVIEYVEEKAKPVKKKTTKKVTKRTTKSTDSKTDSVA
jgi:hypothetical protein